MKIFDAATNAAAETIMRAFMNRPDAIATVLGMMGSQNVRTSGRAVVGTCPIHGGDNARGFYIWFDRNVPIWKCMTQCNCTGPLFTLPMKKWSCDLNSSLGWLSSIVGLPYNGQTVVFSREQLEEDAVRTFRLRLGLDKTDRPNVFPEQMVQQSMRMQSDFYLRRGYSPQVLAQFEVGFVPARMWTWQDPNDPQKTAGWFDDRVSVPFRMIDGTLVGFHGRRIDGMKSQKWQTLTGTSRSFVLGGLHQRVTQEMVKSSKTLIIVEGMPDVWRGWMHGVYNIVTPSGTAIAPNQIDIISRLDINRIVMYYDADEGGMREVEVMAAKLCDLGDVFITKPAQEGKDPGDLVDPLDFIQPIRDARIFRRPS